jgi:multidrug efflux pump subunit AcrB
MWIVRLALRRPYTFLVMAILIVFLGIFSIRRTPTDIFPDINIPVVTVVWTYQGLSADDMARRITTFSEYAITNTVNDIQRMESQTLNGLAVIRIFFYPQAQIDVAISQVTAVGQTILRRMPPGTVPPLILRFNASSVPVMQLALSGRNLTESQLNDFGLRDVRNQLATLQGITLPLPYGGAPRQIMVDIDPQKLLSKGLTANDVLNAVNAQNLVLPSGSAKIGATEYTVSLNSSPGVVDALNELPVRTVNGATVYLRDIAHVRDGLAVQTNIVRNEGQRSVLLTVIKNGATSTLDLVSRVRGILPNIQAAAPEGLQITPLFDQSVFVSHAIEGVFHEALIACCLTGTLILLFLGSWRSTLIVLVSIPLSILTSIVLLGWLGFTINVMTLGGLALAIGILVDDATVTVENIHRHMAMGKALKRAILDGAHQIAIPALVATLCICIVFVSVLFLEGPARFLFVPFALAVVFAVFMSYILSRTLVPVLVHYLLRGESAALAEAGDSKRSPSRSFFGRFHAGFTYAFERFRRTSAYRRQSMFESSGRTSD